MNNSATPATGVPKSAAPPDSRFDSVRVLLIEDERIIREIVVRMLKTIGIKHVREAATAEAGWESLVAEKQSPFHLVITDLTLPGASGATFIRTLRERFPPRPRLFPIIVLTGRNDLETYKSLEGYGVSSYLIKPVSVDLLRAAIEKALFSKPAENKETRK